MANLNFHARSNINIKTTFYPNEEEFSKELYLLTISTEGVVINFYRDTLSEIEEIRDNLNKAIEDLKVNMEITDG